MGVGIIVVTRHMRSNNISDEYLELTRNLVTESTTVSSATINNSDIPMTTLVMESMTTSLTTAVDSDSLDSSGNKIFREFTRVLFETVRFICLMCVRGERLV